MVVWGWGRERRLIEVYWVRVLFYILIVVGVIWLYICCISLSFFRSRFRGKNLDESSYVGDDFKKYRKWGSMESEIGKREKEYINDYFIVVGNWCLILYCFDLKCIL